MTQSRKDFSFKGKMKHRAEKHERDTSFGYLVMPSDIEVYIPEPGRIQLDIVPYIVTDDKHPERDEQFSEAMVGDPWPMRPFKIHRNVGPENDTFLCLESIGQTCPICEYRLRQKTEGPLPDENDKEFKDRIYGLKAKDRVLYYLVPIGSRDWDEDFHIFDISYHNFQKQLDAELKEDEDYEDFPHPTQGRTLEVRWEKDSFEGQKFCKANRIDFNAREHAGYTWEEIEGLPSLDDIILKSAVSYADLKKAFLGFDDEGDEAYEDTKEEEKPARRKRRTIEKDEFEEQPEEKEEKPARRKRTTKAKDDQPEEKPARRKRASKKEDAEECPYGHKFGVDTDDYDDCNDCKLYDACLEAQPLYKQK